MANKLLLIGFFGFEPTIYEAYKKAIVTNYMNLDAIIAPGPNFPWTPRVVFPSLAGPDGTNKTALLQKQGDILDLFPQVDRDKINATFAENIQLGYNLSPAKANIKITSNQVPPEIALRILMAMPENWPLGDLEKK